MNKIISFISKTAQYNQLIHPLLYLAFTFQLITLQIIIIYPLNHYISLNTLITQFFSILTIFDIYTSLIITIISIILAFTFQYRFTFFRIFYLISIFSACNTFQSSKLAFSLLLILLTLFVIIIQSFQNINITFCSDAFLNQNQNITKFYTFIFKIALALFSTLNFNLQIYYSICFICSLLLLFKRFFNPYNNIILQSLDIFFKTIFLSQCLIYLGMVSTGTYSPQIVNVGFLISAICSVLLLYLYKGYTQKKMQVQFQINESFFLNNCFRIFSLFYETTISDQLQNFCNKINKFVEYQRIQFFQIIHQKINVNNKKQWAIYIYNVILNQLKNSQLTFSHYINFCLMELYFKSNWVKSIDFLEKAKNATPIKQSIFEYTIKLINYEKTKKLVELQIQGIKQNNSIPFQEFKQIIQIIQQMVLCTNSYSDLWRLLNQKQVHMQKIITQTSSIKTKIKKIEHKVEKINFKSNNLNKILISFYYLVTCDCHKASQVAKIYQKNIQKFTIKTDIKDYIYVMISLEKQNLGQMIKTGFNQNLIKYQYTNLSRNLHIDDFLPPTLVKSHTLKMNQKIYRQNNQMQIFPFTKLTYSIIQKQLRMLEINLKPIYNNDCFSSYGFMKFKKTKDNLLILVESQSKQILFMSQQFKALFKIYNQRSQVYLCHLFPQVIQSDFDQLFSEKKIFKTEFQDELSIISSYQFKCVIRTQCENGGLYLIEICKLDDEKEQKMILRHVLSQYLLKQQGHKMQQIRQKFYPLINSKLQRFFSKKKGILEKYNLSKFSFRIILTLLFVVIIIFLNLTHIILSNQQKQFKLSFLTIISQQQYKNWMVKRIYLQFFYTNFYFVNNTSFSTIDLNTKTQLNLTFTKLTQLNKQLVPYLDKNIMYPVNLNGTKSLYSADIFKLLQQTISSIAVLVVINLNTTNPVEINAIKYANSFIQYNEVSIMSTNQYNILTNYMNDSESKYRVYIAYYYLNVIFHFFIMISIGIMLIHKERQKNLLKQQICDALLSFESNDLILFNEYSNQFIGLTKGIIERKNESSRKKYNQTKRNQSSNIINLVNNDIEFILTQDQLVNSKKKQNKQKNKSIDDLDQLNHKTINKSKSYSKIQILTFVAYFILIFTLQIIMINKQSNILYDPNSLATQYKIITRLGIKQSNMIFDYVNLFSSVNPSNQSSAIKSTNDYLNAKQTILNLNNQFLDCPELSKFNILLDKYLYSPIMNYTMTPFFNQLINSTFQNLMLSMSNNILSTFPNAKFNASFINYLAWSEVLSYSIYNRLSIQIMTGIFNMMQNCVEVINLIIKFIDKYIYGLCLSYYLIGIRRKRKNSLNMLQILKQTNFQFQNRSKNSS